MIASYERSFQSKSSNSERYIKTNKCKSCDFFIPGKIDYNNLLTLLDSYNGRILFILHLDRKKAILFEITIA